MMHCFSIFVFFSGLWTSYEERSGCIIPAGSRGVETERICYCVFVLNIFLCILVEI